MVPTDSKSSSSSFWTAVLDRVRAATAALKLVLKSLMALPVYKSLSEQSLAQTPGEGRNEPTYGRGHSVGSGKMGRRVSVVTVAEKDEEGPPDKSMDSAAAKGRRAAFFWGKLGGSLPTITASDALMAGTERRESLATIRVGSDDAELDTQIIRINVGGVLFNTTRDTLKRFPETFLGSLNPNTPFFNRRKREYFFDRNPTIFASILDLYRTSELHLPRNYCGNAALRELDFWEIPAIWVSACCWSNIHDAIQDKRLHEDLKASPADTGLFEAHRGFSSWKRWVWNHLYDSTRQSRMFRIWNNLIAMLIAATLVIFFVDSRTEILPHDYFNQFLAPNATHSSSHEPRRHHVIWLADVVILGVMCVEFLLKLVLADVVILGVMCVEFLLKLVVCPRLKHVFGNVFTVLYGLSLLACIAGHIAESIMERPHQWVRKDSLDAVYVFLRCVHFLRMIRFFELLDRNASLKVMWIATKRCQTELLLLLGVFIVMAIFFGALAYFTELYGRSDGEKFTDGLALSLYWAVITMSTVGYGDITPAGGWGRLVGALCSICGVLVLAMPVAVLTESFQQYNLRQKIRSEKRKRQEDFFRRNSVHSIGNYDVFSL